MKLAPVLDGEEARLAALRRYDLLDVTCDPALDEIALLAAQICGTPVSLVSLVESDRVFFKASVGPIRGSSPRELSLCAHAIYSNGPMVVPDAREDERFHDHPFCLDETGVVFYAGEPLVTGDGHPIGTLCVIDHAPRVLRAEQFAALAALARQVVAQFELGRHAAQLGKVVAELGAAEAELRATRVSKSLVREILRSSEAAWEPAGEARRGLGRRLGSQLREPLEAGLEAFAQLGVGRVRLVRKGAGRFVFEGSDLIETAMLPGRQPACAFAFGYLEGLAARSAGSVALGAETECVAQGRSHCTFHVRVGAREA